MSAVRRCVCPIRTPGSIGSGARAIGVMLPCGPVMTCNGVTVRRQPIGSGPRPMRVLLISWEYPPVIEGGLGRHVRKLSEQLVRDGVEVHVLTRGGRRLTAEAAQDGGIVHRVRERPFPKDASAFVRWVDAMNRHMHALAAELCDRFEFDLVHSHDWLVAGAADRAAREIDRRWLVTVHATEYGRHQGWGQ